MNKKLMLNNAQLLDLVRNELSEGGSVKIKARGNSMRPLIQGNRDELVLCKPNEDSFKKGSIVIWKCANCGHIHVGENAPQICPVCSHPQAYFQIEAKNY